MHCDVIQAPLLKPWNRWHRKNARPLTRERSYHLDLKSADCLLQLPPLPPQEHASASPSAPRRCSRPANRIAKAW